MRAVEDHHVDRPGVEAWQHVELTGTNRSIGLRARHAQGQARTHEREIRDETQRQTSDAGARHAPTSVPPPPPVLTAWWLWRGCPTRFHPELGRETPQRRWYCVLRRGRVGRRQVFKAGYQGSGVRYQASEVRGQCHLRYLIPDTCLLLARGGAVR